MARIDTINQKTAEGQTKQLLDTVNQTVGFVPNLMTALANSPQVLEAYLAFSDTLGKTLNPRLREQISLITSELNGSEYCTSAHSAMGKSVGLDEDDLILARLASSNDARDDAGLKFVKALIEKRGKVTDIDVEQVKSAGFSQREITEIVAYTSLNIFTNYFSETAKTVVDFPKIDFPLGTKAFARSTV